MIRSLFLVSALLVSACGAASPKSVAANREDATRWDGESCTRDAQCFSLWCANHECVRREP